ncbi:hypothetical protein ECPA3_0412, partial [Escherichia coli PA3]
MVTRPGSRTARRSSRSTISGQNAPAEIRVSPSSVSVMSSSAGPGLVLATILMG